MEQDGGIYCDDDTLPKDPILTEGKELFLGCSTRAGRPLDMMDRIEESIRAAGFINVQHTDYKLLLGDWPKLQVYKDAGRVCRNEFKIGMDG